MQKDSMLSIDLGNVGIKLALKGILVLEQKTKSPMHSHAVFELHLLLRGNAELETEEQTVSLSTNDVVLVFPDVFHKFSKEDKGTQIASISFSLNSNNKTGGEDYLHLIQEQISHERDILFFRQNSMMTDCLKKPIAAIYSKKPFAEENVRAQFVLLFTELFSPLVMRAGAEFDADNEGAEYDTRIAMIENYFNDHYMEDITLKKLADLLYLSEKQTHRMIQKAFGTGFREQLTKMRMRSAKKFLRDGVDDIAKVAEEVGYQSYNGFYMAFKRETGLTPQEYRKKHQKA